MYSKTAPQLVLGLSEQKITARLTHPVCGRSETSVNGVVVCVQKKLAACSTQLWTFTADGNICCQVCQSISAGVNSPGVRCVNQSVQV